MAPYRPEFLPLGTVVDKYVGSNPTGVATFLDYYNTIVYTLSNGLPDTQPLTEVRRGLTTQLQQRFIPCPTSKS
jgi:hypothetical protein